MCEQQYFYRNSLKKQQQKAIPQASDNASSKIAQKTRHKLHCSHGRMEMHLFHDGAASQLRHQHGTPNENHQQHQKNLGNWKKKQCYTQRVQLVSKKTDTSQPVLVHRWP
jgi:hypothetical protein|mmetsp:Transcript_41452/g.69828  ORF Transcript_41452/g.69828 Transcript_41452/m.69828 type:complete len:110 (-) Transcript_41452:663-992(-)